jgi:hypothetical protein
MFALSASMLVAQRIFKEASRPLFGNLAGAPGSESTVATGGHGPFAVEALRALGWALLEGLNVRESPSVFIRTHLLDTRYAPLFGPLAKLNGSNEKDCRGGGGGGQEQRRKLTALEKENVAICIARILPHFESLGQNDNGIALLVVCHLLELWAVELVGASQVANAWEAALCLDGS